MARPGRKPFEEELRLRERIEGWYLSGLRPAQIRDALASAQNQVPIELSLRQVQSYVARMRRSWVASLDPAQREAEWAELVAANRDVIRVAAASSARYRDDDLGVGYLNSEIKGGSRSWRSFWASMARWQARGAPLPRRTSHRLPRSRAPSRRRACTVLPTLLRRPHDHSTTLSP